MICDVILDGKRILITGGTGSLGKTLIRRVLTGAHGTPERAVVFSRDEAKQHEMRLSFMNRRSATDEIIYHNFERVLEFVIGDVRDYQSVAKACRSADIVVNAAALKQVPSCEYFPYEAVLTNVIGPQNIVRAISELGLAVEVVVGVSTDKACKPVNVMGMTKALQERVFVAANVQGTGTRYICVRYGNVLASRGSVIPLFHEQIAAGGPVTLTTAEMTRFLLSLEDAVDTVLAAIETARPGETYIPRVRAARVEDIAKALIGQKDIEIQVVGIRPGEKLHESLISEEEGARTVERGDYFVIRPMLPEIASPGKESPTIGTEISSDRFLMDFESTRETLAKNRLLTISARSADDHGELLR